MPAKTQLLFASRKREFSSETSQAQKATLSSNTVFDHMEVYRSVNITDNTELMSADCWI